MTTLPIYTTPTPFTVGQLVSADDLNPQFSGNMEFLKAAKRFRIYRGSTDQSLPNNTLTAIQFNAEEADPWDGHSNSSNASRWTCPAALAGVWRIYGQVEFDASATGARRLELHKNGTAAIVKPTFVATSGVSVASIRGTVSLVAGDYVELKALQSSGGALDADLGASLTFLEGEWLGEVV